MVKKVNTELKWYIECARRSGIKVVHGNGGGYKGLARQLGYDVKNRAEGKAVLARKFGNVNAFPASKSGPAKTIYKAGEGQFNSTDAFLQTYEWRRVRMEAIKKYGSRCQCCGATPADGVKMNVDHIKPRKLYPALALDINNLQVLCEECNHGKGNWDMTDWRGNAEDSGTRSRATAKNDL
jgi:5-methylcytosine-specific restriction endonuclease McrA